MAQANGAAAPLTRDELQQIADGMVMGDVWRGVKDSPDNRSEAGMLAYMYAARRLGIIEADADLGAFLDRVRQDDFVAVNSRQAETEGKGGTP